MTLTKKNHREDDPAHWFLRPNEKGAINPKLEANQHLLKKATEYTNLPAIYGRQLIHVHKYGENCNLLCGEIKPKAEAK